MNSPEHQKRNVSEYVELEAPGEKVKRAEKISSERNFNSVHDVWDVETDQNRYWVITDPTNLYLQSEFPSMDYALSFHVGIASRMMARQQSNATDEDIWRAPKSWRQWEQAHEALDAAEEAEDFQGVGVRCREILITLVNELDIASLTNSANADIKKADVKGQLGVLYESLCAGSSLKEIRSHLKNTANSTWDLVGWLTHYKNAVRQDAQYVMSATEQVLLNTISTVVRSEKPQPQRCPQCKSYKVISDFRSELMYKVEHPYVNLCEACGWEGPVPK
jgi:predicted RNA-binding Zn-ribbon protein involved in translation (DUF1610 family)